MVLLLKSVFDVLPIFREKPYEYYIKADEPVPVSSLELWRKRGYAPSCIGCAHVKFAHIKNELVYPAYMWEE